MKKIALIFLFCSATLTNAQVGIGTSNPQGALEIVSTADGLIIPKVALTNTNTATILTPTKSELIYNTATTGDVSPGYYYWETTPDVASNRWVRLAIGTNNDWSIAGNNGTTAGTHFIGTTDAQDLRIKTGGSDKINISNSTGQFQTYTLGSASLPAITWANDNNTGIFKPSDNHLSISTNGIETVRIRENSNVSIGANFASNNAAPTNGVRIEGQTVIGKPSGEDSRDIFSTHTSSTAFQTINGYPNNIKKRAISGYADDSGIGIFGFSNRSGYGVIGLTQANSISSFVQTGEGVLGQADGATGSTSIPIGVHGIIDETVNGDFSATPVLGENNNITKGTGLAGGVYNATSSAVAGVYGNIGTRASAEDAYQFGVVGDILLLGPTIQPEATGGVLGANASGDFGILGYVSKDANSYCVYGGGKTSDLADTNNGKNQNSNNPNNLIGLGINGGFMGGYVKGDQFGLITKGTDFGMYVTGKTITNEPIIQLTEVEDKKEISYSTFSTQVDISTRGIGKLNTGEIFIEFKESFKNLISEKEPINITITPTEETNGVYISKVTKNGFYVKENNKGKSNASFNWVAIGTKKGYENGVVISNTILQKDFDKNMNKVMNNDGNKTEGMPIHFDGTSVKFEKIPAGIKKFNIKKASKK